MNDRSSQKHSYIVGLCILLSRIAGLIREVLLAHFLGTSVYSDAFKAALRIPNFLQNLFGEGVLSATFIPVYARLRKLGKTKEAKTLAKECGILLACLSFIFLTIGMIFSDQLVLFFAPGFEAEIKELTSRLLKIIFPGTALLVLSAWCLGILNSHRYFALSYSAPLMWNFSIIGGLGIILLFSDTFTSLNLSIGELSIFTAYLVLVGCVLQLLIQVPKTLSLIKSLPESSSPTHQTSFDHPRPWLSLTSSTKEVLRNFLPVSLGRGIVQISAYVDTIIASFLVPGSLSVLMYSQTIFLLPISVFGMAVAAAELPALSEENLDIDGGKNERFLTRLESARDRVLFFVVPCSIAFIFFGENIISLVFQSGSFGSESTLLVALSLASLSLGLVPATIGRLCSSSLYALSKHRSVTYISLSRLIIGAGLGVFLTLYLFPMTDLHPSLYIIGLGIGSTIGTWFEYFLLNKSLKNSLALELSLIRNGSIAIKVVSISLAALLISYLVNISTSSAPNLITQIATLGSFGISYFLIAITLNIPEAKSLLKRFK